MKPPYEATMRAAIRMFPHKRMSPPNWERLAEIAGSTGITTQSLYNWRAQWQKEGPPVPAMTMPSEQWSPADKLAAVIHAAVLESVCRPLNSPIATVRPLAQPHLPQP
jgi:hypothetical protein